MSDESCMHVGSMIWRIGDMVDFWEQLDWLAANGFEGIAFHTAPTFGGDWASFDVREGTDEERARLAEEVQRFRSVTIHAESFNYDIILESPNEHVRAASVLALEGTFELGAEIGASVITVHRGNSSAWAEELTDEAFVQSVDELSEMAAEYGVAVGFEIEESFATVVEAKGPVGITLDTGHVAQARQKTGEAYPTVPELVELLGENIIHTHVHDFDGEHDHVPIGHGRIDFGGTIRELAAVGYTGMLCLELNPDRSSPEEYMESKSRLEAMVADALNEEEQQ